MKTFRPILIIGITEVLIGGITLLTIFYTTALSLNEKTPNVLLFVIITSIMSTSIGLGLLKFKKIAYDLLIYFSSVIILSKLLILLNIIQLNGAFETIVPSWFKNWTSIIYHGVVIFFLTRNDIRNIFYRKSP